MCNQASPDHLRSSQVVQAAKHSNSHTLKHLRPNRVEYSTVVTFLIKTACATLRHMGAKPVVHRDFQNQCMF